MKAKCCVCARKFEVGDLIQQAYLICESIGWEKFLSNEHTEMRLVHKNCGIPTLAELRLRQAMRRIMKDNSPDAVCMPIGGGSEAAIKYVQERNEPKEK